MALVLDIETAGYDFKSLSESMQEFLLRYAEKEKDADLRNEKIEDAKRYLSLYPLTAKVIVIGMLNTKTGNSIVLFEGDGKEGWDVPDKHIKYISCSEEVLLARFWQYVQKVPTVITFNGRNFDIPFLMIRSALLNIKPSRNFITNRYHIDNHIDLLDQFTFYGITKKFNLDFYCQSFGITSPKSKGITGMDVKDLYNAGRIKDIAIYCGDDVIATYNLYKIWNEYLNI